MRWLAALVFGLAVAGSTLAGTGLVVLPHVDPPGAPRYHDHVLAAYRFALFEMRLAARIDPTRTAGPRVTSTSPAEDVSAALVLALLILVGPRLVRAAARAARARVLALLAEALWSSAPPLGPPRAAHVPASR